MDFVPFDATEPEAAERRVLRPGVPTSMRPALTAWLLKEMSLDHDFVRAAEFRELENNLDISFGLNAAFDGLISGAQARELIGNLGERELLRAVDYLLYVKRFSTAGKDQLAKILAQGRSKYEPVRREERYRLAERVPEGVQVAAEQLITQGTAAGQLLRKAWASVYDLEPDDSVAYSTAVKAVEAAALPALGIAKESATLSDAVRTIEKQGAGWRLPFLRAHGIPLQGCASRHAEVSLPRSTRSAWKHRLHRRHARRG